MERRPVVARKQVEEVTVGATAKSKGHSRPADEVFEY